MQNLKYVGGMVTEFRCFNRIKKRKRKKKKKTKKKKKKKKKKKIDNSSASIAHVGQRITSDF